MESADLNEFLFGSECIPMATLRPVLIARVGASTAREANEFTDGFNWAIALAFVGWPPTLVTRGEGPRPDKTGRRKNFAAIRSRLGENMDSVTR